MELRFSSGINEVFYRRPLASVLNNSSMIIDINQKKIAFGDKYKIFINGEEQYFASTELISLQPKIHLFGLKQPKARLTMTKKWNWFSVKYSIRLWDNSEIQFKTISFWKSHYQCCFVEDVYDIYGHRGLKHSIYKNNVQVAWWDKEMVSWFEGDNYKIVADEDSLDELIIGFCLMIDNSYSNKNGNNTLTIDLGKIGPQTKRFNTDWRPKQLF